MKIDKIFVIKDFPECCMKCDFINLPIDEITYYWCLITHEKESVNQGLMLRYRRMSKCPLVNQEFIYDAKQDNNLINYIKGIFGG